MEDKNPNRNNIIFLSLSILIIVLIVIFSMQIALTNNSISKLFKGSEFELFYNGSKLLTNGNYEKIYDSSYYQNILEKNSTDKFYRPHYTPLLYYFYVPFSMMPKFLGVLSSTILFITIYLVSVFLLIGTFRRLYNKRYLIIFFSLIFPPFIYVILNGHPSALWILILTLTFYYCKKDMPFAAGIILSFFIMKPNFYILIFLILLLSFKPKLLLGLLSGTLFLFFISGIWDGFYLWKEWFNVFTFLAKNILNKNTMIIFGQYSERMFFYPLFAKGIILQILKYIFIIAGLCAVVFPILYSYFHKNHFSRNSFWLILTIAIVLASPYIYNYDLIVLILPIIIFFNLAIADRVLKKYVVMMITILCLSVIVCFLINQLIHIQLFTLLLWFFLINGTLGKRIRHYTPKTFIEYWDDY